MLLLLSVVRGVGGWFVVCSLKFAHLHWVKVCPWALPGDHFDHGDAERPNVGLAAVLGLADTSGAM